jgi:hypothetical protein
MLLASCWLRAFWLGLPVLVPVLLVKSPASLCKSIWIYMERTRHCTNFSVCFCHVSYGTLADPVPICLGVSAECSDDGMLHTAENDILQAP